MEGLEGQNFVLRESIEDARTKSCTEARNLEMED